MSAPARVITIEKRIGIVNNNFNCCAIRQTSKQPQQGKNVSKFMSRSDSSIRVQQLTAFCVDTTVTYNLHEIVPPKPPIDHLDEGNSCKPCDRRHLLVLVINSRPSNHQRRKNIRSTWGNNTAINNLIGTSSAWRLIFVVGHSNNTKIQKAVEKEANQYKDLLMGTFTDNYANLTLKTVFAMRWAHHYCKPFYLFKGDDDIFLNAPRLMEYVGYQLLGNSTNFWVGRVNKQLGQLRVVRKKGHKYYVPYSDYSKRFFPPFCSGFAYIMSGDVVAKMLSVQPSVKLLKMVDDAYLGILAEKVKVKPVYNHRFHVFYPDRRDYNYTVPFINMILAEHNVLRLSKLQIMIDLAWGEFKRRSSLADKKLSFENIVLT